MTAIQARIDELKARLLREDKIAQELLPNNGNGIDARAILGVISSVVAHHCKLLELHAKHYRKPISAYLAAHFTALATAAELDALEDQLRETQK